jgi:thioredoxin 1
MTILDINQANFATTTLDCSEPVLVDFGAEWCAPCRALTPILEAMARDHAGRLRVGRVDADEDPDLCARFGVRGLPTLLLFHEGKVVGQLTGLAPRARIEALVERAIASRQEIRRPA